MKTILLSLGILFFFLFQSCTSQRAKYNNKSFNFQKNGKNIGAFNYFYENGNIALQEYYIDGVLIYRIQYDKHGKIKYIHTNLYYPEKSYYIGVFGNKYKNGKLIEFGQMDLDSLNRFYDLKTFNNGKLKIDSLARFNDSINHRPRFLKRDTSLIPFKIIVVDNKDTLLNGFDFFLSKGSIDYYPIKNSQLDCFMFKNVDSICDFNLLYKNRIIRFKNIETARFMHEVEWTIQLDSLASDTCYDVIYGKAGFGNFWLKEISKCEHKNLIWLKNFEILY